MANLPGLNLLAGSSLWGKPIDKIDGYLLTSFIRKHAERGQRDAAETALSICTIELLAAVHRGEISTPAMVHYSPPFTQTMTAGELTHGLKSLGKPIGAAILFGLETGMTGHDVGRLTWHQAMRLFNAATLSDAAIACTRTCPRHLNLQYVFWQDVEGLPHPLLQLEYAALDTFGTTWPELASAYSRLIMIDTHADRMDFTMRLSSMGVPRANR